MQNSYPIGTLAETIVAVKLSLDGTLTPIVRWREPRGRMIDSPERTPRRSPAVTRAEFVVRIADGDSGIVTMALPRWDYYYTPGIIPLGKVSAFEDSEVRPDADRFETDANTAAGTNPNEVWFCYEDGKLTWKSENVSGAALINETYPEIIVSLRLPPGNHGEISFASPLFTTADGEPASVLSVA